MSANVHLRSSIVLVFERRGTIRQGGPRWGTLRTEHFPTVRSVEFPYHWPLLSQSFYQVQGSTCSACATANGNILGNWRYVEMVVYVKMSWMEIL
jgi:hypothetical protein